MKNSEDLNQEKLTPVQLRMKKIKELFEKHGIPSSDKTKEMLEKTTIMFVNTEETK